MQKSIWETSKQGLESALNLSLPPKCISHFPFSAEGTWLQKFPHPSRFSYMNMVYGDLNLPETVCTLCGTAGLGKSSKDRFTLGQAWNTNYAECEAVHWEKSQLNWYK